MQESSVSHHCHTFPPLTGSHLAVFNPSLRKQQWADQISPSQKLGERQGPKNDSKGPMIAH